jgi:hypothetical protein
MFQVPGFSDWFNLKYDPAIYTYKQLDMDMPSDLEILPST